MVDEVRECYFRNGSDSVLKRCKKQLPPVDSFTFPPSCKIFDEAGLPTKLLKPWQNVYCLILFSAPPNHV